LKTQIITLESHDDLISVRDKLSWAKTPRILLVWPKYEDVVLRVLDLKVLQRHADSLGAQLGLVTRRTSVRRDAESLGIPVFDSTASAQKELWPAPASRRGERIPRPPRRDLRQVREYIYKKETGWSTSLPGRVLTFTVGVAAVLAIAGIFVPRATVILYPETLTQSVVIPVAASESFESLSLTGNVPARKILVIVETDQTLAIISEISVPESKAQGIARFTNLSQGEVKIPAGTVVSTDGETPVRYVTLHETLIQPGADEFVDVPIEALQAGSNGNAPTNTIVVVEGALGVSLSVTNPKLVSGGTDAKLTGAADTDRAKLRETVMDNLRREAESKLRAQISFADLLLPDTFEASRVIEETYSPPVGEAGKTLNLKMQVEFFGRYVSETDLRQLSLAALGASMTEGFEPAGPPLFEPRIEPLTDSGGVTHFDLEVTRILQHQVDERMVLSMLRGSPPGEVRESLMDGLSLRQEPDILLTPGWWPWMPLIPFNIMIETK